MIDEARTPLIISGPSDDRSDLYHSIDKLLPGLNAEDYDLDEKQRTVNLTEAGNEHMEALLRESGALKEEDGSLYDAGNVTIVHHVNQALRAPISSSSATRITSSAMAKSSSSTSLPAV